MVGTGKLLKWLFGGIGIFCLCILFFLLGGFFFRNVRDVQVKVNPFFESAKELQNPYRGYYRIFKYYIMDERQDFTVEVGDVVTKGQDHPELMLLQLHLGEFKDREISKVGLENIDDLLGRLTTQNTQWIFRILYDWVGENEGNEPDIQMVLKHLDQMEPLLKKYDNHIYIMQGLSVGNWGEMHGTEYNDKISFTRLLNKYREVTGENVFLSVRTPRIWRMVSGRKTLEELETENFYTERLGLFNDGMFGNESDLGTYFEKDKEYEDGNVCFEREEELEFQDILCRRVPNGGEVVLESEYSDLDKALPDLRKMHVTYLNKEYDMRVLNKWKKSRVKEEGCFNGMDGYTYIERHLGYRYFLDKVDMVSLWNRRKMVVFAEMKNVGFAPIYEDTRCIMTLVMKNEEGESIQVYYPECDLAQLVGGTEAEEGYVIRQEVDLSGLVPGEYKIYMKFEEEGLGKEILLGNVNENTEYGYELGTMTVEPFWKETIGNEQWNRLCDYLGL